MAADHAFQTFMKHQKRANVIAMVVEATNKAATIKNARNIYVKDTIGLLIRVVAI